MKNLKIYKESFIILMILFFLTFVTVFSSQFNFGKLNTLISLLIATTKGTFVLIFFMHMKHEPPLLRWLFVLTIVVLAIMIGFTFTDVSYRMIKL